MLDFSKLSGKLFIVLSLILGMILFEAVQQYYYVLEFDILPEDQVSFLSIFKGQLFRWAVWTVFAVGVWKHFSPKDIEQFDISRIGRYALLIFGVTALTILTMSILSVDWLTAESPLTSFSAFLTFFIFQKGAIFMMAFTGLLLMIYLFKKQEVMEVQLKELVSLKDSHSELYEQLKASSHDDQSAVIPIKTGNRTVFLPVEDITRIEADDYCVRIVDIDAKQHTLRSSLKQLESKLAIHGFIRVHRKHLVNTNQITALNSNGTHTIVMTAGEELPIAQNRLAEVKKLLSANLAIA